MLYHIGLNDEEKNLLYESFKENDKFLEVYNVSKEEFDFDIIRQVEGVLNSK